MKVNDSGIKTKPAKLSQDDIKAAKKEWEDIVLSEGKDKMQSCIETVQH